MSFYLAWLAPEFRPTVRVDPKYAPVHTPDWPVEAIIIGERYAAFPEMWQHKSGADEVIRIEKFDPWIDPKRPDDDHHKLCNNHSPGFNCSMLIHDMLMDFSRPIELEWKKKQPWYKPKG